MNDDKWVVPEVYTGPEWTLRRFQAGAIITRDELLHDLSRWVVEVIGEAAMRRLKWMIEADRVG